MKFLYHHRIASKDGQYVHVEAVVRALRRLGHEVVIVGPGMGEGEDFGGESGFVRRLKERLPSALYESAEFAYSLIAYRRLARAVRQHRPDVVYERYNLFLPSGVWLKKRFDIPLLLEVNAPLREERSRYGGIALDGLARWSEGYAWRGADRVICVTDVLAGHVQAAGVAADNIAVMPNGIDPEELSNAPAPEQAKAELGLDGRVVIGFTGFVREWHGLDAVVDMLASPGGEGLGFLVVGDGPARQALSAQAAERGVARRVVCTGVVGRDAVARHVAAFDIALQPKAVPYASPLKLFEYMAMSKAIVAPAQANIMEILCHDENALLFDPSDRHGLAAAVGRLATDSKLRARLGEAACRAMETRDLTWRRNAERVAEISCELVGNDTR